MDESQRLIIVNVSMSEYSRKFQGLKVYLKTSWKYNDFVLLTPQDSKEGKRIFKHFVLPAMQIDEHKGTGFLSDFFLFIQ